MHWTDVFSSESNMSMNPCYTKLNFAAYVRSVFSLETRVGIKV